MSWASMNQSDNCFLPLSLPQTGPLPPHSHLKDPVLWQFNLRLCSLIFPRVWGSQVRIISAPFSAATPTWLVSGRPRCLLHVNSDNRTALPLPGRQWV
jgi:hypothetical protein